MPTRDWTARFEREYLALTPEQRRLFRVAVRKFVADLRGGRLRKGLRVKPVRSLPGTFEMTWAPDGRAIFRYGDPVIPGEPHIIWERIGGHEIFENP